MSRNGSGVYSLPAGNPVVTGTTISSSWANTTLSDIATALTGSVAADGQTAMTGNLQMGNNKVTGLAVATTSGDALSYAQAATVSALTVTGNASVGGTFTLTGGLTLNGNVTVGDSSSDTLTVNATSTFAAGATFSSTFAANGGVTLGDASGDALTINSSAVSIPNGLNFDSNTFVIDATNNRVGVGVASPAQALSVLGNIFGRTSSASNANSDFRLLAGAYTGNAGTIVTYNGTSGSNEINYGGGTGQGEPATTHIFLTGTAGSLGSGSERMRITSTGNVGIGTSSPTRPLHINATGTNGTQLLIQSGSAGGIQLKSDAGKEYEIQSNASSNLIFYDRTATATRLTLDSSGNLGLGVTPSAWGSIKALELANGVAFGSYIGGSQAISYFTNNAYFNGTNWIYKVSGSNAVLQNMPYTGGVTWNLAPSGTAGNAITFTQAMTLDASGNLQIGTTTNRGALTVYPNNSTGASSFIHGITPAFSGNSYPAIGWNLKATSTVETYTAISTDSSSWIQFYGDVMRFYNAPSVTAGSNYAGTERMRIDSSGNLLVGTTDTSASSGVGFKLTVSATAPQFAVVVNQAGTSAGISLYNTNAGAYRFYVNNAGTIFATSTTISAISDQRLKENVRDLDVGLSEIMSLQPRKFDWKQGKGLDKKDDVGFVAQEFETIFPNSVTTSMAGEDGVEYKTINHGELIPTLVKAIQELKAEVDSLKAQLNK